LQAASRMEPEVSAAFIKAVEAIKGTVNLTKLAAAVSRGEENGALAILALDKNFGDALRGKGLEAGVQSFREAIQATYAAGARAARAALPAKISVDLSFNLMSKEAQSFLEAYDFKLIREITDNSHEAIRQIIQRAFKEGGNPIEQARKIREVIGLTARQEQAVANFRAALSDPSTMRDALSRALRDGRFDPTVLRAAQSQTPLSAVQVDKMTARYRERYLKYRSEAIARTETIRASAGGRRETWKQAEKQGLFGSKKASRVWHASGDTDTCGVCMDLDGEKTGLDEEFAPGIMDPPDPHVTCRCDVGLELT